MNAATARCLIGMILALGSMGLGHACPADDYAELRAWIKREDAAQHNLDIFDCLQSNDARLVQLADASGAQGDLVRYLVAWAVSNAIEKGGLVQRSPFAATWWQRYLLHVRPPLDSTRINHGLNKLVHHGRLTALEEYLPTVFQTFGKLEDRADETAVNLVLNTLYRCDSWAVPTSPDGATVCRAECKPLFETFVSHVDPEASAARWSAATRANFKALAGRLTCAR